MPNDETLPNLIATSAATIRAHRYDVAEFDALANSTEDLARELAHLLARIGVGLPALLRAAERPVSNDPAVRALISPDVEYALTVAIDEARQAQHDAE